MSQTLRKQMEYKEFVNAFYIGGYLKPKTDALNKFLKGGVASPDKLSFSENALKSYMRGDPIHTLASALIDAGLSTERISAYIKSLYETKHKGTPTYKKRYGNKTYKEALFDQVKGEFDGITLENMSEVLAKEFFSLIKAANEEYQIKALRRQPSDIGRIVTFIQKIDQTVSEMITIGRNIAESHETTWNNHVSIVNLKQSLLQKLSQLSELSSALYACNDSDLGEAINRVFIAIQSIDEKDFILTEYEYMILSNRNLSLHHFLDVLNQLRNEVKKMSNS